MNWVPLPKKPTPMHGTIYGNSMLRSRGGLIRSALFACGTAKAGMVLEARSTCLKQFRNTPGEYTFWIQIFFGRCGAGYEPNGEDPSGRAEKNLGAGRRRYSWNSNSGNPGADRGPSA